MGEIEGDPSTINHHDESASLNNALPRSVSRVVVAVLLLFFLLFPQRKKDPHLDLPHSNLPLPLIYPMYPLYLYTAQWANMQV